MMLPVFLLFRTKFLVLVSLLFIFISQIRASELKSSGSSQSYLDPSVVSPNLNRVVDSDSSISILDNTSDLISNFSALANTDDKSKTRRKRYLYLNVFTNLDVGYLIIVPITVVIPPMSNLFNKWRRRRRSISEDEVLPEFEDHPVVQPHLDKISTYFELLDIPEHHCQLRAICEFSADPSAFYPLSEMIINRLREPYTSSSYPYADTNFLLSSSPSSNNTNSTSYPSLFLLYNNAADDGTILGISGCQKRYGPQCKYPMDKLLHMPNLRIWKGLKSYFGINVKEDVVL